MLKDFLESEFQANFKFISFKRFINIFEMKELAAFSQTNFTFHLKKISNIKNTINKTRSFNEVFADTLLFEKLRGLIAGGSHLADE